MIDEQGRLFGVVNVIDLAVVLVVVCVVVAGLALVVTSGSEGQSASSSDNSAEQSKVEETRYVTLDVGVLAPEIAETIEVGDTSAYDSHTLNVTDVAIHEQGNGEYVHIRAALVGEQGEDGFEFAGAPPRLSRTLSISTPEYNTSGRIRAVDTSGRTLDRRETSTVVAVTAPETKVDSMAVGDTFEVAGRDVASIETLEIEGMTEPGTARAYVGVSYETVDLGTGPQFGETRIEERAQLPFRTDEYDFEGLIIKTATTDPPGTLSNRTVTLELDAVNESLARRIEAGMTEEVGGETVVEITDVERDPSQMVLTTDGEVVVRDHPIRRDVTITARLQTRQTSEGLTFKGERLYEGNTVLFDLGETTIRPTVVDL